MPSSSKTAFLELNRWSGEDKPKMADFNADNQRVDDGVSAIRTLLDVHTSAGGAHLTTQSLDAIAAATAHIASADLHITEDEKSRLDTSSAFTLHTYDGDDQTTRHIVLGFQPRFGFLFAVNKSIIENTSWVPTISHFAAFFSQIGCSGRITLESDGITVQSYNHSSPDGNRPAFNQAGETYVIIAAK
ncbi:MAG: hypothetical protein FWH00_00380 [Oscillospiraceae bacterium]|nr:hypothetical protein [Oscillospiraceae bacterium]